ncbi:hypothetical protein MNL13_00965 [Bartonella krasnovii]|uniref:Phage protein n=1 Tax=Bartonella krasnovii TaxID=2267275 RepID=A0ABY3VVH7_9HYPH|nr:hypothetical protein [Bartonella krasnovii]UNF29386.1 hypothetical protein MNL13_00965 [Bartonella krasnovii]UNF35744.1 hypothetical protein MNL12_00965 [Bartonella krasnovii]UNF37364.1 hypothetical protein MNL11_00970 [Bartonella krasnovii]UNF48930.1 hypothetical protein MNL04_00955 [Bartonella krasnovii]UNF52303.1 hypothetical protein MNL02_00965 [Bartonella krasnovii]
MKLKFKLQEFQNDAVKSVTDLFKGQPQRASSFSLRSEQGQLTLKEFGYGNLIIVLAKQDKKSKMIKMW